MPPDAAWAYAEDAALMNTTNARAEKDLHAGMAPVAAPDTTEKMQMRRTLWLERRTNRLKVKAEATPPRRPLMPAGRKGIIMAFGHG